MNSQTDRLLFSTNEKDHEEAFRNLFKDYYASLCYYALQFVKEDHAAEEIVQDILLKIWEKRKTITIESSVKHYLFRSVRNACLNLIQHNKVKNQYATQAQQNFKQDINPDKHYLEIGLAEKIEESIESLPEKRKEIFRLCKEDGLKYKEIADKLKISVKTVEAQMGLALKTLREKLKDYHNNSLLLFHILLKLNRGNKSL